MARYMVERNYVQVIGTIWMPAATAAMEYTFDAYAIRNLNEIADIRHKEEQEEDTLHTGSEGITREDVEEWLTTNSGDFQSVTDFCASIGDTEIEWEDVESAFTYHDSVYGDYGYND